MERLNVTPAVQGRSQRTMARIEAAFESLLEEHPFDAIAVADVCALAKCSVGTFYGRFSSKDALLEHVRSRLYEQMQDELSDLLYIKETERTAAAIHQQLHALVHLHRSRRGLLRAAVLQARQNAATAEATKAFNRRITEIFCEAWLKRAPDFDTADPEAAVRHVFFVVNGALRERILFDELWPIENDDQAFADRLAVTVCRELGVPQ